MTGPIVALLGPRAAGKSSVGRHLADLLGWPQRSVDALCWDHYRELPPVAAAERTLVARHGPAARDDRDRRRYLERLAEIVRESDGEAAWWILWERMRLHAAVRGLTHDGPAVVDLGAGHIRVTAPDHHAALDAALARCRLCVWLQPSPDPTRAAAALARRLRALGRDVDEAALRAACEPAARPSAAAPIYTDERDPAAIAEIVHARLGDQPSV